MSLPIRITYKENADHVFEGFKEFPNATKPAISQRKQNIFTALIGGTILYALWEQYKEGREVKILVMTFFAVVVVFLFWFWFFKKIGLTRDKGPMVYQWSEKYRARFEQRYEKTIGRKATMMSCEFDESEFRLTTPEAKTTPHEWTKSPRAVEVPAGFYLFIGKRTHFWFSKKYFASGEDYRGLLSLLKQKVPVFERFRAEDMAFIALGANQGKARRNIERAMNQLGSFSNFRTWRSSIWQTTPVDCPPGSPLFVNAVVGLLSRKDETPESLLKKLQAMEKEYGRQPKKVLNEARPLDLDIIAFANETRNTQQLILPHPRAHQRRFVLQPLSEIAPDLVLPGQTKTVIELLAELPPDETMKKLR